MPAKRRNYSVEYRTEAVKRVIESSRPVAQVARELGILEGTLGNWVAVTIPPRTPTANCYHCRLPTCSRSQLPR
jgi:hypothetical protein